MIQNLFRGLNLFSGLVTSAWGGSDIEKGEITKGAAKILGGGSLGALATAGLSEDTQQKTMKFSAVLGAGTATLQAGISTAEAVSKKNYWQALKSAGATLIGGATTAAFALMPPEVAAKVQFAAAGLGTGAYLLYKGGKDLLKGKVLSGANKILAGAGTVLGGAMLATSAYDKLTAPEECIPCDNVAKIFEGRKVLSANLDCENCGMFCVFQYLLGVMRAYNPNKHLGLEVDFQKSGLNYDEKKGPNWFNYFFEPVKIGNFKKSDVIPFSNSELGRISNSIEGWMGDFAAPGISRKEASELFQKYFKLRPELKNEIENFISEEFKDNYVIGIHYRGTDKVRPPYSEANRVSYETMFESIRAHVKEKGLKNYKIFVATDEEAFVEKMRKEFPNRVVVTNIARSTNDKAIHFEAKDKYEMGKGALKDCLLLARSHFLIRTSSNLSLFSKFINPNLPSLEVSGRSRYNLA